MKLIVDVPNSLYANLSTIKNESVAGKRILECVKNGKKVETDLDKIECTCWVDYPNESHKFKNGKWKCVDNYECVRKLIEIDTPCGKLAKIKTKCVKVR